MPVPMIAIFISAFHYGAEGRSVASESRSGQLPVRPVEDVVAEQFGDGGEAEAAGAQGVDDLRQSGEGLAAGAAAVVHEDDRAVAGVADDVRVDRAGPGQGPVARGDGPVDGPQPEAAGGGDGARVGAA